MICPINEFLTSKCGKNPQPLKDFVRFLHRHGLYGKYVFNYINASESWRDDFQNKSGHPYHFILRAFYWKETPQGESFWRSINEMWLHELEGK